MIGLDTNILVRYLTKDDPDQVRKVRELFKSSQNHERVFVSLVVMVELFWVLQRQYRLPRHQISKGIGRLLEVREIAIQDRGLVVQALEQFNEGADFADALIADLNKKAGCSHTVTFDKTASKQLGMKLLK